MATMTVTEARAALPALLDRVQAGEEVAITRHGRVVAVVVRPEVRRARAAADALALARTLGEEIEAARSKPIPKGPGISEARAEELIAAIRADRDAS